MPKNMNVGILTVLIKNYSGDLTSTDNIRPITLSDTIAIIFENYILEEISNIATEPNQFGFKKNASTSHAIFVFREGQRVLAEKRTQGYAIFFDFSKAFDRVSRVKMLHGLLDKMDNHLWLALYQYYEI